MIQRSQICFGFFWRLCIFFFFFFSSRRRHTRCREVSWARRCVQETGIYADREGRKAVSKTDAIWFLSEYKDACHAPIPDQSTLNEEFNSADSNNDGVLSLSLIHI
eukprot:TRINITY_DN2813_c0_g1_i4.p1 TRINITY_DN2813_c0_g1~~TRINITY_DN2813_c0_g1_i4.p1  ORF type:complete len:106 (-),score=34.66 TRINITY_DN2813_c0_g1_i4:7-324(-)